MVPMRENLSATFPNRNWLSQILEIPWNKTTDVHLVSTLITRVIT